MDTSNQNLDQNLNTINNNSKTDIKDLWIECDDDYEVKIVYYNK
jgi:hypothetical protein